MEKEEAEGTVVPLSSSNMEKTSTEENNNDNNNDNEQKGEKKEKTKGVVPLIDLSHFDFTPTEHYQDYSKTDDWFGKEKHMPTSDYYWNSYAHFGIHQEMLKDEVRTKAYKNAIMNNAHLFRDKIVLDVGCGTGIMCLFAAKVGAKLCIGVDNSGIIEQAKMIVKANGMEEKIVLIRGKMEEIELPVEKVDIIVSEWMGYFLFYESMLNTVIYARDKYLKEGGIILPDKASLTIAAIEDADYKSQKFDWWKNVWGFNMGCIPNLLYYEALVDSVNDTAVVSTRCQFLSIDIMTVTEEELDWSAPFRLQGVRKEYCHAFMVYFDMWFTFGHKLVHFTTGPHAKYTHWKQTIFYLREAMFLHETDEVCGIISAKPNEVNPRDIDITLRYKFEAAASSDYHEQNVDVNQVFYLR